MDNENIKLLRLRNFTICKSLADDDFRSPDAQAKIAALIGIVEPFVRPPSCLSLLSRHLAFPSACPRLRLLDLSARISYKALFFPLSIFPFLATSAVWLRAQRYPPLNPSSEDDRGVSEGTDEGMR